MKIRIAAIPREGALALRETVDAKSLDVFTGACGLTGPVHIYGEAVLITNALTVALRVEGTLAFTCGRCIKDSEIGFSQEMRLSYSIEEHMVEVDLSDDIREEILLAYPMNPLCDDACKGLCPKCGKDLNKEKCSCK
jgi:uncharacterized protein